MKYREQAKEIRKENRRKCDQIMLLSRARPAKERVIKNPLTVPVRLKPERERIKPVFIPEVQKLPEFKPQDAIETAFLDRFKDRILPHNTKFVTFKSSENDLLMNCETDILTTFELINDLRGVKLKGLKDRAAIKIDSRNLLFSNGNHHISTQKSNTFDSKQKESEQKLSNSILKKNCDDAEVWAAQLLR